MPTNEALYQPNGSIEHSKNGGHKGSRLAELVEQKDTGFDQATIMMLKLILEQNKHLSSIEVVIISPEEEPDTGGYFHRVQIDERTYVPTIFIVSENDEHLRRLKNTRQSSARRVADMLGLEFSQLTPSLLRQFIIAHEIGHASDYIKNYERNPDYMGADAAEKWELHYEANLLSLPVPGYDPVDLHYEISKFTDLQEFLDEHPDIAQTINIDEIKTLPDLQHAQEIAYRNSAYESYVDNFATSFLKNYARELNLPELMNDDRHKQAA